MQPTQTQHPTVAEQTQFAIRTIRGVEVGLGQADLGVDLALKLQAQYPNHLALVQVGAFLHGYDRTAHALATLKNYRLKLVGATDAPHIRVGFPAGNFKKRLWSMVDEFQIPYAVSLGSKAAGYTVYVSDQGAAKASVLSAVSPQIVREVIADLLARGQVNEAKTKQLLTNPDTAGFNLKTRAADLDLQITQDIIKMPRDVRTTYGANLRECMARLMRGVFAFGMADNKRLVLLSISADVDLLKHYLAQAPRLNNLKLAFEHRVGLAVELGRIVGGLIRAAKVPS